jgi:adenine-specific DNA-methyltransferase
MNPVANNKNSKKDYSNLSKEDLIKIVEKLESRKKYGLIWDEDKVKEQFEKDAENALPVLKEVKGKEISARDESRPVNILIEGDNYHALSVLNFTHQGKVDVIYIDPPYNTGEGDFKYNDKWVDKTDIWRHSKWLSFIAKRIRLAKTLLSNDGVIFISIDDNEFAQLKLLMNEIFGESNYYGCITWIKRTKSTNSGKAKKMLQQKTEYILAYGTKPTDTFEGFELIYSGEQKKYPHKGKFGSCRFENLEATDYGRKKRDTMKFPILGVKPRDGRRWQIGKETADQMVKDGKIELIDGVPMRAVYPDDEESESFIPFWSHLENVGTAETGKQELNEIIGPDHGFDTVKPTPLLKTIFERFKKDITVLDFFAGTGTTGQVVMEMNKDGGKRQFILCTNDDGGICTDVCYPRISNVIKGYKTTSKKDVVEGLNTSLKYFKTKFIKKTANKDDLKIRITKECTEMLCLREGIFEEIKTTDDYRIFQKGNKILAAYYSLDRKTLSELKKELNKLEGDKTFYCFTLDPLGLNKKDFSGWKNVTVEPIPQKILDVYKQIYEY